MEVICYAFLLCINKPPPSTCYQEKAQGQAIYHNIILIKLAQACIQLLRTSCMAMAYHMRMRLAVLLCFSFLHATLGEIICEDVPTDMCAFSIASSGKRCTLETAIGEAGAVEYQCRTSEVVVEAMAEWIETDDCVKACGIDRNTVGISSDYLMEPHFTAKLCSPACYHNCPNVVDLYFNLAAGEGVFLPNLCQVQRSNPHRAMAELLSSGVAPGPIASQVSSIAALSPAPA